ncbi:MAG: SRPBCC domain-containing protein [Candidatus Marinimicrobia bacterium]|nr:SRPBCC domain-containing protein [Candidatus Neomarinimicrobiota bacterium]MCF7829146.1 SRPBCC domain-containing protein [Candidatus Neomarinimicrobiota bacterium]MCF7881201.1 SRPBCC domain-containing protein [Candidatus Neomarinimicrobiota bacterium]
MSNDKLQVETKGRELVLSRVFDAPKDLLFQMWSSCEHLSRWWGPKEWPMDECTMDFRVGGEWLYCLRGPNEGDESWGKAIYQEIDTPDKLVYKDYFTDSDGAVNNEMPEMRITVEFIAENGQTRMIETTLFDSPETRESVVEMGVVEGMNSSLDRLEERLAEIQ